MRKYLILLISFGGAFVRSGVIQSRLIYLLDGCALTDEGPRTVRSPMELGGRPYVAINAENFTSSIFGSLRRRGRFLLPGSWRGDPKGERFGRRNLVLSSRDHKPMCASAQK